MTNKSRALEYIVQSMMELKLNIKCHVDNDSVEANARAMKNLAMAYTLVKRGVMLPDWIKDEKEDQP